MQFIGLEIRDNENLDFREGLTHEIISFIVENKYHLEIIRDSSTRFCYDNSGKYCFYLFEKNKNEKELEENVINNFFEKYKNLEYELFFI